MPLTESLQSREITSDQGFLFRATPTFELVLSLNRIYFRQKFLRVDQTNRPTPECVRGPTAIVVSLHTCLRTLGVPNVEGFIGAAENVDGMHLQKSPSTPLRLASLTQGRSGHHSTRGIREGLP